MMTQRHCPWEATLTTMKATEPGLISPRPLKERTSTMPIQDSSRRSRRSRAVLRLVGGAILWASVAVAPPASASDPNAFVPVKVVDPRPLAAAADQLQNRYGVVVHYEDPPYVYEGDLVPANLGLTSGGLSNGGGKGGANPTVMIPAGTGLDMSLAYEPGESMLLDLPSILQGLVELHEDTDQPGRFKVDQTGGESSLIPYQVRQGDGTLMPVTPVLDTPIVLGSGSGTALDALQQIVAEASKKSEQNIKLGMVPGTLLHQSTASLSGGNLPARDFLAQLVSALPHPVAWRLLYDANHQAYYLNLMVVRPQTTSLLIFDPSGADADTGLTGEG